MNPKRKYFLVKMLSYLLSFVLGASIVTLAFSSITMGLIQSKSNVVNSIESHEGEILSEINKKYDNKSEFITIPMDVFQNALQAGDTRIIVEKSVENMLYKYSTDFSDDEDIYQLYKSGMTRYCQENNIDISNSEIEKNAALAVDVVDEALGGYATSGIKVFRITGSGKMMYVIVAPILFIIISCVLLEIINYGRHRKFSYIGLGVITSGYVMTAVSAFFKFTEFTKNYRFCTIESYNNGIADIIERMFSFTALAGIILFLSGLIILFRNYRYFYRRNQEMVAVHEHNEVLRGEYLDELNSAKAKEKSSPANKNDREVTKIDF